MADNCTYTDIISAKDGSLIPAQGGIAFHSTYNPVREGEQFAAQFDDSDAETFFVVIGLCGGFHIQALLRRFPRCTILAVEKNQEDIDFLKSLPVNQQILQNGQVQVCAAPAVSETLSSEFIPAEHHAIKVVSLRSWEHRCAETAKVIKDRVQETLPVISADFSVQSHFGGIWQRNIFVNLHLAKKLRAQDISIPTEKKAAVIAAGPSLDEHIQELIAHRDSYVIIATDTGYRALLRRGIKSDFVVSVDAQMVSHAHFFGAEKETTFVLDISGNPATARKLSEKSAVQFVQTGHPLSACASQFSETPLPFLHSGSGTVTIAAADFAVQAGFREIVFFGTDFGYLNGKAYARGTYLDDLYNAGSNRLNPSETRFSALLFRSPLIQKEKNRATTKLLESYEKSLTDFMIVNNFIKKADNTYIWAGEKNHPRETEKGTAVYIRPFDTQTFFRRYESELHEAFKNGLNRKTPAWVTLLPYLAWLKRKFGSAESFEEIIRQAYTKTLEYTERL